MVGSDKIETLSSVNVSPIPRKLDRENESFETSEGMSR